MPSSSPNPLLDPFGAAAAAAASAASDAETATGLAGGTTVTPWAQLTPGFQSWLNAGNVTQAQWGSLSGANQQALANAFWIQNSAGGNAGNLLNLAAGAQDLSGVGSAASSPGNVALSPFTAVGNIGVGLLGSGVSAAATFVFQTVGDFLTSFVSGALKAGASWGSSRVLGLVVALVVVMVLFR